MSGVVRRSQARVAELRAALQQAQTRMAWLHSRSPASSHKAATAARWLRDQRRRCGPRGQYPTARTLQLNTSPRHCSPDVPPHTMSLKLAYAAVVTQPKMCKYPTAAWQDTSSLCICDMHYRTMT